MNSDIPVNIGIVLMALITAFFLAALFKFI